MSDKERCPSHGHDCQGGHGVSGEDYGEDYDAHETKKSLKRGEGSCMEAGCDSKGHKKGCIAHKGQQAGKKTSGWDAWRAKKGWKRNPRVHKEPKGGVPSALREEAHRTGKPYPKA